MNDVVERVVNFDCEGERLIGILSEPKGGAANGQPAVLIVVGGPQYRAGAHRMFVQLARAIARAGMTALRFDVRGMGDSSGEQRSFEQITPDIGAAIAALRRSTSEATPVVVFGLCDGASAALIYLHESFQADVSGVTLLNPWFRSNHSLAQTHFKHYYIRRLASRDFWAKVFRGEVGASSLLDFSTNVSRALGVRGRDVVQAVSTTHEQQDFRESMLRGWSRFEGKVQLALSGDDLTAQEFTHATQRSRPWQRLIGAPETSQLSLPGADHTLSTSAAQFAFQAAFLDWVSQLHRTP
ncbi:MAG: hydrolase 1, exosortase A system-associated [Burkholderiaceae bacterium]|nr:hydrolase 1, exosortase A system-associated [Burkholderiaceae bacterium]